MISAKPDSRAPSASPSSPPGPSEVFDRLRHAHAAQGSPERRVRIERLKALRKAIVHFRPRIQAAMAADFGKPPEEADLTEILPVLVEIKEALGKIRAWTRPRRVPTPLILTGTRTRIHYQPLGIVLILAPWNYPITLTLGPLVTAVAAGNRVIIKPSEFAPSAAAAVKAIVEAVFDPTECAVLEGDHTVAESLVNLPFDHVFFTGSPRIGRLVMAAAAQHHTSVTLELGGKSPAVVDTSANLDRAARTIAFGKFSNAGQTCIAPDYVVAHADIFDAFVERLRFFVRDMFSSTHEQSSTALVVTEDRCRRLKSMLDDALSGGASIVSGGAVDIDLRQFEPTVLVDVRRDALLLQKEIFGPILPVLRVDSISEALDIVASKDPPLTVYLFSRVGQVAKEVISKSCSGNVVINDTLIHWVHTRAPFGGIGASGFGRSHGFAGFKEFSNERVVVRQLLRWPPIHLLYPPFEKRSNRLRSLVIKYLQR
jgi:aldehyde dehydrogenase (NAD+)